MNTYYIFPSQKQLGSKLLYEIATKTSALCDFLKLVCSDHVKNTTPHEASFKNQFISNGKYNCYSIYTYYVSTSPNTTILSYSPSKVTSTFCKT